MERLDYIKDLKTGMKNVNLQVIALEVGSRHLTKDNHEIRTVKVADRTGSINMCVWDEPGAAIQGGDICRISRSYVTMYKNTPTLYTGRGGRITKIGEFCFNFSELPNMSEEREVTPVMRDPGSASGMILGGPSGSGPGNGPGNIHGVIPAPFM